MESKPAVGADAPAPKAAPQKLTVKIAGPPVPKKIGLRRLAEAALACNNIVSLFPHTGVPDLSLFQLLETYLLYLPYAPARWNTTCCVCHAHMQVCTIEDTRVEKATSRTHYTLGRCVSTCFVRQPLPCAHMRLTVSLR